MNDRTKQNKQEWFTSTTLYSLIAGGVIATLWSLTFLLGYLFQNFPYYVPTLAIFAIMFLVGRCTLALLKGFEVNPTSPKEVISIAFNSLFSIPKNDLQFVTWLATRKN